MLNLILKILTYFFKTKEVSIKFIVPKKCLDIIKKYEGFKAAPYLCSANVATIGYGTTYYPDGTLVKLSDPAITEEKASELLHDHTYKLWMQVLEITKSNALNENQLSALVSFAYNLGIGALLKSTLLKKLKVNDKDPSIRLEFQRWVKAGGKTLKGLERRRKEEADLYFA